VRRQRTPRLSLDLLRGFRAAARHLSFTLAARELCVTQSAVSQEVKSLEGQLGVPLFTRVNRTLRLTQAGEQLYRATDEALALIDATTEQVAGAARSLSITTTVPFASLWLGPRLPAFTRRHPDIRLRLVASNDNLDIAREHIDVAIRHAPHGTSSPPGDWIFDYETFPVCSPALMQQPAPPLESMADLAKHVLLDLETVRNGRPWYDWQLWMDAMKIRGLKPAGYLRFSHYDQVIAAAISGAGIAVGRWPHLASHLRKKILVAPLGDAAVARFGRFHVVVGSAAPPAPVEAFLSWLRAEADDDARTRAPSVGGRTPARKRGGRSAALRE
jgi:LysR family glycine cleavage system transcriptional activator